jgi:hypothetical protein
MFDLTGTRLMYKTYKTYSSFSQWRAVCRYSRLLSAAFVYLCECVFTCVCLWLFLYVYMVYFVCHCYLFLLISVSLRTLQSSCLPVYLYICLLTLNKDYTLLTCYSIRKLMDSRISSLIVLHQQSRFLDSNYCTCRGES